jgi:hypothetical protein
MKKALVTALIICLICTAPLSATMIVVIKTPDGYWIGADSSREKDGKRVDTVCKIHPTQFGVLAKFGASQGLALDGTGYSTDKEVEDLVQSSNRADDFKTKLQSQNEKDIVAELVYLINEHWVTPETLSRYVMLETFGDYFSASLLRGEILFEIDGRAQVLMTRPVSKPDPMGLGYRYSVETAQPWIPLGKLGTTGSGPDKPVIHLLPSVRMFAMMVQTQDTDSWVQNHPLEALKKFLDQGHTEAPEDVGPPYTIVHIIGQFNSKDKVDWIEKGACPGWTEKLLPDGMRTFRNHSAPQH